MSEQQQFGRFSVRRIIVIAIICAALAGGAAQVASSNISPVQAATSSAMLVCDGSALDTDCAMVEGSEPGPVVPLGYSSATQARFHCAGGTVVTLYRQHKIVGYGCDGGKQ